MTRRQFGRLSSLSLAALLVSGWTMCNKTGDMISSLRNILNQVEVALKALSLLSGLLPEAVNKGAEYLIAVCHFVDAVGRILEDETALAVDRARQILSLAADLPLVDAVPDPVGKLLRPIAAAVDHFLSFFGTDATHARSAQTSNPPDLRFNQKEKQELEAIERTALQDKGAVEEWQRKALVTPHSSLTTPSRGEFLASVK